MSLANLFHWLRVGAASPAAVQTGQKTARLQEVLAPADVRARSVDELLTDHQQVIARIKLCYGCDNASFAADLLEPIRNYACYVNALPATGSGYYRQPGGMFRLGLEVAFYALQATDSQIFAGRQTISNRRVLEPRWRRATFIAGLCSELYRCYSQLKVRDAQGNSWQPYLLPLTEWLRRRRSATFQVQWLTVPERRAPGLFALPMVVPAAAMADLALGNDVIVPNLMASISGLATYHDHNVMERLVRHAVALVIHRERIAPGGNSGAPDVPVHLARHLVEAMRELVHSDHNWLPNASRSRLWYGADGMFLVWPNGAADVIRLLADERLPGAPDTADAVLDILIAGGIVPAGTTEAAVVRILPPGANEPMEAILIAPPSVLLADVVPRPAPIPHRLVVANDSAPVTGAAAEEVFDEEAARHAAPMRDAQETEGTRRWPGTSEPADEADEARPTQLPLPAVPCADEVAQGKRAKGKRAARPAEPDMVQAPQGKTVQPAVAQAALRPPLRLNRTVARALSAIISTLHGDSPQCHVLGGALFVPLASLSWQGVDARQAWRSLQDAGMLENCEDDGAVQSQVIDGTRLPGVFIAAQFVTGVAGIAATPVAGGESPGVDA